MLLSITSYYYFKINYTCLSKEAFNWNMDIKSSTHTPHH